MKYTVLSNMRLVGALNTLSRKNLPLEEAEKVQKISSQIDSALIEHRRKVKAVLDKYAKFDKDGKIKYKKDGNIMYKSKQDEEKCREEVGELNERDYDIEKITLNVGKDFEISAQDLVILRSVVDFKGE